MDRRDRHGEDTDETSGRRGLLEDLSVSQVLAGALAAVTSVALSSRIGIAGSLIGVAAASVVSTVASQLYRGMLRRANDKIRELASSDGEQPGTGGQNPYGLDKPPLAHGQAAEPATSTTSARIAPAALRAEAHRRRQQTIHRRVMAAAVVSSLVAVAISAGVVLLVTNGEGLGQRVGATEARTSTATTETAGTQHAATSANAQPTTQRAPEASAQTSTAAPNQDETGTQTGSDSKPTTGNAGDSQAVTADKPQDAETGDAAE